MTIQNVPSINQFYESFQDVTKVKEEFHELVLKEANGLIVVMAQPQHVKHFNALGHFYLLECGFLPYGVYSGDLVGFQKKVLKWKESPTWWSQLMCAYGVFSLPDH